MHFENSYQDLPEVLYQKNLPTPVNNPELLLYNEKLARELGIHSKELSLDAEFFAGNKILAGSVPISQAYAGHQFAHFNILGDGRAHLLGEILDSQQRRWDIQLKGSGPSKFSRRGDGRAALGPMLREYLISEFMAAMNIPTTRSLAVVKTGEPVFRETVLKGAILTRVASSHIRVGTFEFANYSGGKKLVQQLADYCIHRHYKVITSSENRYLDFLKAVVKRQASLIAGWMNLGFIHGVMNTDNMSIAGETIDYGPCAFMDRFDPAKVFSSIDQNGRYAYGNQPAIGQWNLARLAECLLPLLSEDKDKALSMAEEVIQNYRDLFQQEYYAGLRKKLGLLRPLADEFKFFESMFQILKDKRLDYNQFFVQLGAGVMGQQEWLASWEARVRAEAADPQEAQQRVKANNPFVIPRNYWVEEALKDATEKSDMTLFQDFLEALQNPMRETHHTQKFLTSPKIAEGYRTFCGT